MHIRIYSLLLLCIIGMSNMMTRAWQFEKRDNSAFINYLQSSKSNWLSTDPATRVHLLTKKVEQQEKVLQYAKKLQAQTAKEAHLMIQISAPMLVYSLFEPPIPIFTTIFKTCATTWIVGSSIGYGLVTARVHAQNNILTRLNKKLVTAQKEVAQLQTDQ